MYKAKVLLTIVFVFSITPVSRAVHILYVDVHCPNDPGSGTFDDPFRRIQYAIDAAVNGDVIEIRPGVYTGASNYDLDPNGKSITIRSIDPNVAANTIIDPNGAGRGFYFHSDEDANCIVWGLTIRDAYTVEIGAGIYCEQSSPTIISCSIIDNHAEPEGYGGAIFCVESNSIFVDCTISGNSAYDGGGVSIRAGYPQLINCIISNNHAGRYGGGITCYFQGNPNVVNCSLINNTAGPFGAGGAISLWDSDVNIQNSILWANYATYGTQLYLHFGSSVSVSYSNIQGGISDVCVSDGVVNWGSGNIDSDPCFASFDSNGDPNLWDFHLQSEYGRWNTGFYTVDFNGDKIINLPDFAIFASDWMENSGNLPADLNRNGTVNWEDLRIFTSYFLTAVWLLDDLTSPCIDAGDPNSEWSNEPWPNGKSINMGAYGGTEQASKNGNIADLNIDGIVDFMDFAQIANQWMVRQICIEDLTGDGVVNFADISIFAENWLWQK